MNKSAPKLVLDVATGTGDLAIAVQKGTGAEVVGFRPFSANAKCRN